MPRNPLPSPIFTDIETIRRTARDSLMDGPVTAGYGADRGLVIRMLNEALATETVCWLRYKHHAYVAQGFRAELAAAEFREHAMQEMQHAERIAERIVQLRGVPDLDPATLTARSHADYVPGRDLEEMIRENLVAERIAIESYRQMVHYLGDRDPTTRRIIEDILAVEEEHADDMASLLTSYQHRGGNGHGAHR